TVPVHVCERVALAPIAARRVADLVALACTAQSEDDRRVARVRSEDAVLVAPPARGDAPRHVRPIDQLGRDEQLDALVAHSAEVVESGEGLTQGPRDGDRD